MQEDKGLKISVSPEAKAFIEYSVRSLGNRFFEIVVVYVDVPSALFSNILTNFKSNLLDFMLALEKEFGHETEKEDLCVRNILITHIMDTTINNNGDGNVINTRANAEIYNSSVNVKGDRKALNKTLKEHDVQDDDISELLSIVDEVTLKHQAFIVQMCRNGC